MIKKYFPKFHEKIRSALSFRPEDPNNLHQVLPQMEVNFPVERIKGFRFPAPGSRTGARIPTRESADQIYETGYYFRDPRNLKSKTEGHILGDNMVSILPKENRTPVYKKRKVTLLAYDPSGLRTGKTTTWAAVDKVLEDNALPNHLPRPAWYKEKETIIEEFAKKGLPAPVGKKFQFVIPENYNRVRW